MVLVTSEQMQEFDKFTIQTLGVPAIVLMDHAGERVAREVVNRNPDSVVIVCGKGNNGGDGWTAARWLKHWGTVRVQVLTTVEPEELMGEAKIAAKMAVAAGVAYEVYHFETILLPADVYVDALLGTGASGPLRGDLAALVTAINQVSRFTLAIDVPTGVDGSTGEVHGVAIQAAHTVCLGLQKLGTAVTPGHSYAGRVTVGDIGIAVPQSALLAARELAAQDVAQWLPKRSPDSHKGTYGRVGIAVGAMRGAAVLAGLGAARGGAGMIVLGGEPGHGGEVPYEFVVRARAVGRDPLAPFADCRAVVLGPGLGYLEENSGDFSPALCWPALLDVYQGPGVLDADGLLYLRTNLARLARNQWVLTPHPKECSRLLGWSTEQVQAKRLEAALSLAKLTGSVVVLKGFRSLIAAADGRLWVNSTGDASLATAGTGDVLAGLIGGLLAQGLKPFEAAAAGTYLHGLAGELAGKHAGQAGTMASDVAARIPYAIREVLNFLPRD